MLAQAATYASREQINTRLQRVIAHEAVLRAVPDMSDARN
jgi:hypothetical protein